VPTAAQWDTIGAWAAIVLSLLIVLIVSQIRMSENKNGKERKERIKPTYKRIR